MGSPSTDVELVKRFGYFKFFQLAWAQHIGGQPQFYLVHGEPQAQDALAAKMREIGIRTEIAQMAQQILL